MRVRMTQNYVDKLASADPPARDILYWCERTPGFGVAVKAKSGCCSYVVQWRGRDDGQSHRLALTRCSKITLADARKIAQARFAEIAGGINPIEARRKIRAEPTFAEFVAGYLKSAAWSAKAPSTQRSDLGRLTRYLLPRLATMRMSAITPEVCEALHRDLVDPVKAEILARKGGATKRTHRGGQGGARSTCRLLAGLLGLAVKQRLISTNPAAGLELGVDGKRTAIPTAGEYAKLWSVLEELRSTGGTMQTACDVVGLIALTGARKSEIRLLRWRHLDMEAREIRLPALEHKTGRRTGSVRTISLSDSAVAILATYERGLPDALVFPGQSPGVAVDLARPWARIAKAAELPATITLHSLRHGVGSVLADAGMSAMQVATALGHASSRTSERYCHAADGARAILAQKAADLVRPVKLRAVG